MKTLVRMIAGIILLASGLHAQQLIGNWQGTLKMGAQERRLVFKATVEDGKPRVIMYAIDQARSMPASSVTRDGASVKIVLDGLGATYECKMAADGNSINGTWTQAANSAPLTLVRSTPETAWEIPAPPVTKLMAADANPGIEVATVKPSQPDGRHFMNVNQSGIVTGGAQTLRDLIKFGYDVHIQQINGGPSWADDDRFDVTIKADIPGVPNLVIGRSLIRKLLAERFQLTFHREKKELNVYALTVAKGGPKMTKSDNPVPLHGSGGGPRGYNMRNGTMLEFASSMTSNIMDRPVVDQTGLGEVRWNFTLKWTPDSALPGASGSPDAPAAAASDPEAPPDLFTAIQQQLGLMLKRDKAMVETMVIDKAEKPSEN